MYEQVCTDIKGGRYEESIACEDGAEQIEFTITVPLGSRLAQLVERSAVREFYGEYEEGTESIVLRGSVEHGGCYALRSK